MSNPQLQRCKPLPEIIPQEALDHLWSKVDRRGINECWPFLAPLSAGGYARLYLRGLKGTWAGHRIAFAAKHGSPPPHLVVDHLCRNRACCNPDHMRLVTNAENVLSGTGHTARNAAKTHCKYGHEYNPENTRIYRRGRYCRVCEREKVWPCLQKQRARP